MDEAYTWKVTLADGTVYDEAKGNKFDIDAWEKPGAVKKIELIGEKHFECDLETGEFCVDDEAFVPDADIEGKKKLYFRKRRQIRSDGVKMLPARTRYMYGYEVNGKMHIASVQPKQGMKEEEITTPQNSKKLSSKPKPKTNPNSSYKKELTDIKGLGSKIAKDVMAVFPTIEELKAAVKENKFIPVRDDIAEKIKEKFK
jgi:hypothetical protein